MKANRCFERDEEANRIVADFLSWLNSDERFVTVERIVDDAGVGREMCGEMRGAVSASGDGNDHVETVRIGLVAVGVGIRIRDAVGELLQRGGVEGIGVEQTAL